MRIIDRYITKSILAIFISTIFIFCFLYILIDLASNLDELINRKAPLTILYHYYLTLLPTILVQTSPIACLIATLFTYSHLNHNNEIVALRTSGFDFWRIAKPAICIGLVVSALIFWLNERHVPGSETKSENIRNANLINESDAAKRTKAKVKNLTFYGLRNRLYFIDQFDPNTYELDGITIIGFDANQNITEKIVALHGKWTGILWKFTQCQVALFEGGEIKSPTTVKVYPEKLMDIRETPEDFLKQRLNVTAMNIRQLRD
ncbi:MAG: LptF/LptG family permease, partial [Candidatus Omnitrophota bacterium]